jgi:hypothetical protein
MALGGAERCPKSPLSGELLFMTHYRSIVPRIPSGTVEANMAKLAAGKNAGRPSASTIVTLEDE